jgi:SAM-dependent methyltransferase
VGKIILANLEVPSGLTELNQVVNGYKSYQVLKAALELGLFEWLDQHESSTREEITKGLQINGMFTRSFLQALEDMGFIRFIQEKYLNTDLVKDFLLCHSPLYQGNWVKLISEQDSKWPILAKMVADNQPYVDNFSSGPSHQFMQALAERSLRGELQEVVRNIINWSGFTSSSSMLDIGGGHGLHTIGLCQANSKLKGIIFDKPHVVNFTQSIISQYGMEDRVSVRAGDATQEDIGEGYDIVLISHMLYKFRKNLPDIFNRVARSLKPGGLLVSNHWFCSPGCGAGDLGVQELDKAMHSFGHPLCHVETFGELFEQAGFSVILAADIPSIYDISKLHLAVKK